MIKFMALCLIIYTNCSLVSQILTTRNLIIVPKTGSNAAGELFNELVFGGEMAYGSGSEGEEMAWTYKIHGFAELYRFTPERILALLLSHEMDCNPYNNISFNPRKAIWEENVRYYESFDKFALMAGIFHRCKHDIDNSNPPDRDSIVTGYIPSNRALILTGLNAGFYYFYQNGNFIINQQLLAEYYLNSGDYRNPYANDSATWDDLYASVRWTGSFNYVMGKIIDFRLLTTINGSLMNTEKLSSYNPVNIDYRIEFNLILKGKNNIVELFAGYEKMFDETVFINHTQTEFWNIGLRFRPSVFR